jgi:PTS system mannose-specific IID component
MQPFNGHPYLCAMAVGALARLEEDRVDEETIERFRKALRGPLGTVGDRAIWGQWRPISLLTAMLVFLLGASPAWSVAVFLVLYNGGHIAVRAWGYAAGWQAGLQVGRLLKVSWLERWGERLWPVNLVLTGCVAVLLGARVFSAAAVPLQGSALLVCACALGLAAFRFPRRGGKLAATLLLLAPLLWLLGGVALSR